MLWWKETYETWFLFARVYQRQGGKLPRAFGDLSSFSGFDEWWRDPKYGFELFCEPAFEDLVRKVDTRTKVDAGSILLKVNVNADRELILRDFDNLLNKIHEHQTYQSTARFQPSLPQQQLKLGKLQSALTAYLVSEEMLHRRAIHRLYPKRPAEVPKVERKRVEVPVDNGERIYVDGKLQKVYRYEIMNRLAFVANEPYERWYENKMRLLRRQRKVVKNVFENLRKGTFP